ncbi:response regulator [Aerosakkonemataceae cyanobacterium BLCC-F154]|uniref:Response regulator n=1 Tax=Floridaenema fluviatile BLCC-F154 TaxID=3153640 RepID=A0ABV4YKK8_9CYAN
MVTKRVLIIDDDLGIRKIVQISLETVAGWDVLIAASGMEGITIAETQQPDAILLDVMMPGMDGITTLGQIKQNPTIQEIPVILLTAKAQPNEQKQFAKLQVAGVITKPFRASDLVQQMRSLLHWQE